jgi:flagellar protein FliT
MEQTLLGCYQAIEASSVKMLDAARQHDWDTMTELESACAAQIEHLRLRGRVEELSPQTRAEKSKIMLRILRNDAQIRHFAEPWVEHLGRNLAHTAYMH